MSDQGYTSQDDQQGEDGGIFCQNCSPVSRKLGYWLQFLGGVVLFVIGIFDLIGASVTFLIVGSVLAITSPLWVKSPKRCCLDMKDPGRLVSCIIFLSLLGVTIFVNFAVGNFVVKLIVGVCLALAGIWYFLSFFQNGQTALVACIKACCGKNENSQGGASETV